MIKAIEADKSKEQVLSNLMQKYLYEMSAYYGAEMDENGNFSYKYLPYYFTDADRGAYFLYDGGEMIGFALINAHSFTGEAVDNCIAEFAVFPAYRRSGKAMEAIEALRAVRKGSWQLKYSPKNRPGAAFWQKVKEKYRGTEQKLEGNEIAIRFE
ncbi:MAG: GNAT family N-acetyltransferase [Clostridia bacterium]|nr:GNAT family N-acetyltransferase [Clostridia bacterium]